MFSDQRQLLSRWLPMAVAYIFLAAAPAWGQQAIAADPPCIEYAAGRWDPLALAPPAHTVLSTAVEGYAFVLVDQADPFTVHAIESLGVRVLGIHTDRRCLKVHLAAGQAELLNNLPGVLWVGQVPAHLKLAVAPPKAMVAGPPLDMVVHLFEADPDQRMVAELEACGLRQARYYPGLSAYVGQLSPANWLATAELNQILYIEPVPIALTCLDESVAAIGADFCVQAGWDGQGTGAAVLDTGYDIQHMDLPSATGVSFIESESWLDGHGHGSHVAGIIFGRGYGLARLKGVAPGVTGVFAVKVLNNYGSSEGTSILDGLAYVSQVSGSIDVANCSFGAGGIHLAGTDLLSLAVDATVQDDVAVVVAAGNDYLTYGRIDGVINTPGVAKNALTVGAVLDGYWSNNGDPRGPDRMAYFSSRGPTGDSRRKPDLVAPGMVTFSVDAGSGADYIAMSGTSMATPHVAGVVAQLLDARPAFRGRPDLIRAHLMATARDLGLRDEEQGAGRLEAYAALHNEPGQWGSGYFLGQVDAEVGGRTVGVHDLTIPQGTGLLRAFLVWHEPPASPGAAKAVLNNLDLYGQSNPTLPPEDDTGPGGEYTSLSPVDNVEYVVLTSPPAGTLRLKAYPQAIAAGAGPQPYALAYHYVIGSGIPNLQLEGEVIGSSAASSTRYVTVEVSADQYLASGVELLISLPSGFGVDEVTVSGPAGTFLHTATAGFGGTISSLSRVTVGTVTTTEPRTVEWTVSPTGVGGLAPANEVTITAQSVSANSTELTLSLGGQEPPPKNPDPEPSFGCGGGSVLGLGLSLIGLAAIRRRRRMT